MESVKQKDFVEIDYTGKIKEDNIVFDTTVKKTAEENGFYDANVTYSPVTICVGRGHILRGIDSKIIGKEVGQSYAIVLSAEEAFGKKDPKLIQLVSTSKFRSQKINPIPGLQVQIDGLMGVIKTVSGGRTLVDFNHPLASRELVYDIKINRIVADPLEKAQAILNLEFGIPKDKINFDNGKLKVTLKEKPHDKIREEFERRLKENVSEINEIEFT